MTDPISALKQFVPTGPHQDEILVAVGRATARPNRGWKIVTVVLATSQLLTLAVLFWPSVQGPNAPLTPSTPTPTVVVPDAPIEAEVSPPTLDPHSYLALSFREPATVPGPRTLTPPVRVERPLRAGTRQYD